MRDLWWYNWNKSRRFTTLHLDSDWSPSHSYSQPSRIRHHVPLTKHRCANLAASSARACVQGRGNVRKWPLLLSLSKGLHSVELWLWVIGLLVLRTIAHCIGWIRRPGCIKRVGLYSRAPGHVVTLDALNNLLQVASPTSKRCDN